MSATEEDGEEDISHGGRHQPWRKTSAKMERKTSVSDEGRWRGRHQPWRKMERKTSATEEDGKEESGGQQKE